MNCNFFPTPSTSFWSAGLLLSKGFNTQLGVILELKPSFRSADEVLTELCISFEKVCHPPFLNRSQPNIGSAIVIDIMCG